MKLTHIDVREISLVSKAANRRKFLIVKNDDQTEQQEREELEELLLLTDLIQTVQLEQLALLAKL